MTGSPGIPSLHRFTGSDGNAESVTVTLIDRRRGGLEVPPGADERQQAARNVQAAVRAATRSWEATMSTIEQTREYPIDRKQLFAYATDPQNWPSYYSGMLEVKPYERFTEPGDTVVARYRVLGRAVDVQATLLALEPDERIHLRADVSGLPSNEHDWIYADGDQGTRVMVSMTNPPVDSWLGRAIDRFVLPRQFERDLKRSLDNLEDLVVAGLAT